MEFEKTPITLEQMHIHDGYSEVITDTSQLAHELSKPQDIGRLIVNFDNGATGLRDVGGMVLAQRTAILSAYDHGTIEDMAKHYPYLLTMPVASLRDRVVFGPQDQSIGHNFFVNAEGFINAQRSWALQFDDIIRKQFGISIAGIAQYKDKDGDRERERRAKDHLLASMTKNPNMETASSLAVYLAGRSLAGEKELTRCYGETLDRAKSAVFTTTQNIASTTGLRIDMLERVGHQLQRSRFGSFDHLQGLVTTDNTGALGDYRLNTLRVEVQLDGSVGKPRYRTPAEAKPIITHELHHAGSAQFFKKSGEKMLRCGLMVNGQGITINEGMTEYLAQLSLGCPDIKQQANGNLIVTPDASYRMEVSVMLALHKQFQAGKNSHFATLFNAYHGDVRDQARLEQAMDVFYSILEQLRRMYSS